ncbi:MAG: sigma-70 family RNA polymerase sigma factor [Saprospiraceae bacterium]|nr:sigma-70 family RNA polymerase sigma factor [Saprospiraceae bacterium]MCB0625764.1 sigma-70 family RNA polymerase sigma factor [Saprospiraceae bacterium]MCB0676234.1 sigma-70 family RNA polymerase sigma factor [Saprospiraceae bacterium]MCB0683006.1 sigma-70 family RNA polymerase sigma factor [Saprospiraceae bacterium]
MKDSSDQTILEHLRSGDPLRQDEAFRHLYREYFGLVENLVRNNSGDPGEARDVFQDAVIVLFNKAKAADFRLTSSLKTFLYSICRNLWLMELRKRKRTTTLEDRHEFIPVEESIFQTLVQTEEKNLLVRLLQNLGEDCQRILELFYYQRMRMVQIQQAMSLSSEQVAKNKKHKCLQRLRSMVAEHPGLSKALK